MLSLIKNWLARRGQNRVAPAVIILGIDYPSHTLASALLKRGARIIAFIDEEPWNHRTKMLGATVHYPSEVGALAERYAADRVLRLKGGAIDLPSEVQQHLRQLNVSLIEIDATDTEAQVDLMLNFVR